MLSEALSRPHNSGRAPLKSRRQSNFVGSRHRRSWHVTRTVPTHVDRELKISFEEEPTRLILRRHLYISSLKRVEEEYGNVVCHISYIYMLGICICIYYIISHIAMFLHSLILH